MVILLFALGIILWLFGGMEFITGQTVMQQQVAALIGVSGSVLFIGGAIVGAIQEMHKALKPEGSKSNEPLNE